MQVLIVDDDASIREVLRAYLQVEGFEVTEAADGAAALDLVADADLLILDLLLPVADGWQVAEAVRRDRPRLPLLMLTALGDESDRVLGLEIGADDYVVKPFSPREVVARVKALLRRAGLSGPLQLGRLTIQPEAREAFLNGELLELTRLEFDLLHTLARHPGLVWRRERLLERVWGPSYPGTNRTVDVRIAALRKKLGDDPDLPEFIETVHGFGYRFRDA